MDAHLLDALILGIVEGVTEFLPISSTGHLILVGDLLGFADDRAGVFFVAIQTGAMLAVVWEYRLKFWTVLKGLAAEGDRNSVLERRVGNDWIAVSNLYRNAARRFLVNLTLAFLPAAVLGLAFGSVIKTYLFQPVPVALAFVVGGFVIIWAERRQIDAAIVHVDDMTWMDAIKVGLAQCFALIPGTSRAGATIIGGMLFGLSRRAATEFSFFLAVPTLCAAGTYDLWKNRALFSADDLGMFAVGLAVSFACAFIVIRWLIHYVATHDFRPFAWYRIAFGLLVLVSSHQGWVNWIR